MSVRPLPSREKLSLCFAQVAYRIDSRLATLAKAFDMRMIGIKRDLCHQPAA